MKRFQNRKKGRKSSLKKKMMIAVSSIMAVLCILVSGGLLYGYHIWQKVYQPMPSAPIDSSETEEIKKQQLRPYAYTEGEFPELTLVQPIDLSEQNRENYMNIMLVISEDDGQGDLMVLTIDKRHKQVKLTAFLGQTWVKIPGLDTENTLNNAYTAGGIRLAAQTLEQNFAIHVDRYIEVDSQQIPHIIDDLGGVELTLSDAEADYINQNAQQAVPLPGAGTYNLTGSQALCHANNHNSEMNEFDSFARKRDVVMATFHRFQTNGDMVQLAKLATGFFSMLTTDIELDEIRDLLMECLSFSEYETAQYLFPSGDNYQISSVETQDGAKNVLCIKDMNKVRNRLQSFIYGDFHQSGVIDPEGVSVDVP